MKNITAKAKDFFKVITRNNIVVTRNRKLLEMPIIVFLIVLIAAFKIAIPVVLISLFCGTEYIFEGEAFSKELKLSFKG